MLTIIAQGRTTIGDRFGELSGCAAPLLESIVPDAELPPTGERPFVQLAHSELANEDAGRIFGYAGILKANAPVGFPGLVEPDYLGRSFLVFSLDAFEDHLKNVAGEAISELERAGGFQPFLDSDGITASDYLVAGLIECIRWCQQYRAALAIRW